MTDKRLNFDPTINLGHVLSATAFLASTIIAWATMDARVSALETRARDQKEATTTVETRLMARINEERARVDADRAAIAYEIRDLKDIVRQGFRDMKTDMDKKVDKPGR